MSIERKTLYQLLEEITGFEGLAHEPDTELMESGILDSLSFILLLDALEERYAIEIQPTQVPVGVWRTPSSFADFLESIGSLCSDPS